MKTELCSRTSLIFSPPTVEGVLLPRQRTTQITLNSVAYMQTAPSSEEKLKKKNTAQVIG